MTKYSQGRKKRKCLRAPLRVKVPKTVVVDATATKVVVATVFVPASTTVDFVEDGDDVEDEVECDDDDDEDYVDEPDDDSSDDVPSFENDPLFNKIIGQLKAECLDLHLETDLAHRTVATVNTMINRYAKFFLWCFYQSELPDCDSNVLKMLQDIVLKRFQILTKYYKYLRETLRFQPSTVYNLNEEIFVLLNWFAIFRVSRDDQFAVQPADLYAVNLVIVAMRKFYSKERRRLSCKSVNNTVEGLMAAKKWPRGGLKELDDATESQMQWARDTCENNPASLRDPTVYNYFMQLLAGKIYTGSL